MRSNGETESGGGFFSKKNITVMGALAVLVASGWYGYTRYQESSGASLREQILQERKEKPGKDSDPKHADAVREAGLGKEKSKKDSDPKQTFYSMLGKLNLTAEQQTKMNATRDLPLDKEGWTQRKKVLAETLTDEQMQQLKQMYGGGDSRWEKSLKNMSEEDQRAIRRRFEGLKKDKSGSGADGAKGGRRDLPSQTGRVKYVEFRDAGSKVVIGVNAP